MCIARRRAESRVNVMKEAARDFSLFAVVRAGADKYRLLALMRSPGRYWLLAMAERQSAVSLLANAHGTGWYAVFRRVYLRPCGGGRMSLARGTAPRCAA